MLLIFVFCLSSLFISLSIRARIIINQFIHPSKSSLDDTQTIFPHHHHTPQRYPSERPPPPHDKSATSNEPNFSRSTLTKCHPRATEAQIQMHDVKAPRISPKASNQPTNRTKPSLINRGEGGGRTPDLAALFYLAYNPFEGNITQ